MRARGPFLGCVSDTVESLRVVRVSATVQLRVRPENVTVQRSETIVLEVTTQGQPIDQFMIGRTAEVAADAPPAPRKYPRSG